MRFVRKRVSMITAALVLLETSSAMAIVPGMELSRDFGDGVVESLPWALDEFKDPVET